MAYSERDKIFYVEKMWSEGLTPGEAARLSGRAAQVRTPNSTAASRTTQRPSEAKAARVRTKTGRERPVYESAPANAGAHHITCDVPPQGERARPSKSCSPQRGVLGRPGGCFVPGEFAQRCLSPG